MPDTLQIGRARRPLMAFVMVRSSSTPDQDRSLTGEQRRIETSANT